MGIVDEDIAQVRTATDIVAVVSEYTPLKKVGRSFSGLCPFHAERTPSFSVNAEEGLYYCFGCGVGGDSITFLREKEQIDFAPAVEMLAARFGVNLRYTDSNEGEDRRRRNTLHEAVTKAAEWYHQRLLIGADAGPARSYLRRRGFTSELVRQYKLGWAPDDWDQLARSLRLPAKDLVDSGLGFVNRAGRQQDSFRARIMFPIYDSQGNAVGFGGRKLPGADGPKYKNSSESAVYSKSRVLYGLNEAKSAIVTKDEAIVCEGYTDVIGFEQAGVGRAVATCGTSLTEDHVKLLGRFARRILLAFDADTAGQKAAARLYEWERTHNLDLAVVDLPDGVDPGEMAQNDPQGLEAAVAGAKPYLQFRVDRAIDSFDRATAEGRAKAAEAALGVVAEHPDAMVRDQYVMEIASRCHINESLVRQMLADGPPSPAQTIATTRRSPARRRAPRDSPEWEALRLAVHRREEILGFLTAELFLDDQCAAIFDLIASTPGLHEAIELGGPDMAQSLQRLAVEDSSAAADDVAGRLWERYLERQIDLCRLEARTADVEQYALLNDEMKWFHMRLEELRSFDRKGSALEGLLGWFHEDDA